MSLYQKASLVQIPSGYKAADDKLYSVVPNNGDGDFTVSVDADATRVNKDGLIESVAADQARLNYNFIDGVVQPDPHLLLEPTRRNLIDRSEEFNLWSDTGVTVTPNATIAPNGTNTADKLVSSANNWRRSKSFTAVSGTTYTYSIFAKLDTTTTTTTTQVEIFKGASGITVDFDLSNKTISGSGLTDAFIEEYPNDWYRIGGTYTSNGTNNIVYVYPSSTYGIAGTMYFWGAQVEDDGAGGNATYPSSYIPTSGSAVTRTADTCGDAGNSTIIKAEGSLFVDFTTSNTDNFKRIYIISNADFNNSIFIQLRETSFAVQIVSGGTALYAWGFAITLSDRHKIALRYKDGDSQLYYNGTQQTVTTTSGTWFSEGLLNKFTFSASSFFNFYGEVNQAMIFEALTDSELEEITSYKSFGQMAKALLYTIE